MVAALGVLASVAGSAATGPTFDEERRVAAARHATDLARALGQFGPGAMVSSSGRGVYDDLSPFGVLPGLVSGWLGEVLRTARVLDGLTAARLGWLLVTGLAPFAVYALVAASRGARLGALSAGFLVATPRWMHAASAAREAAVVTTFWLLALAAYVASLPPTPAARREREGRRFRVASAAFAIVLGIGIATDLATLWIVPAVVLHYFWTRRAVVLPAFRRGRAPLPAAFLWALVLGPAVLALATPQLWRGGAASAAEWLFAPLTATIEPIVYRGPVVTVRDVPSAYAAHFLFVTTPAMLLLLAAAGALVLARDAIVARRGGKPRDPVALGALCACMVLSVCVGPALMPRVFTRFPPRAEAALPFIAILAAVALERTATRLGGERRAPWMVLGSALIAMAFGLSGLSTASASFNAFARGTRGAIESRIWAIGDGSEVAPLARAIDALGSVAIPPPGGEVPRAYWTLLTQTGRMRTHVESRGASALSASRGKRSGAAATVERDGAVLWSLVKRE